MQDQSAKLEWRDGRVPVSTRFDDPYFSLDNGLEETRHVFLGGNDLPARFRDGFHVVELGFGTGLNLLATWEAWRQAGA
ncbi:MAG: FAD-dependent oxidoreductase, partial [Pseudomonadota bacterium]